MPVSQAGGSPSELHQHPTRIAPRFGSASPSKVAQFSVGANSIGADVFERSMRAADFAAGLALLRVEGAGHSVHQEQPDAVNERVTAFLGAHAG